MYKVGVIGLGSIAAMYNSPGDAAPYCHVGGILPSRRVQLVAAADLSKAVQDRYRERWGKAFPATRYYDSAHAMLDAEKLDIVAVCVRGPHHFPVMMEVIEAGPRAIFLEKPPSCSLQEMDAMVAAARARRIPITVSYSRHWCPHVLRLEQLVRQGLIGEVRRVVGYTGGGFLSYASHTTDLICQFAGYCPAAVFARGRVAGEVPDGYEPEPNLDAMTIEFASGILGVQLGVNGDHGGFYCDVYGTKGKVRAGIYIPPFACGQDGKPIDLSQHAMPPDASVFAVAYEQIADHLDGGPPPSCTDEQFIAVNEIGFAAIESIHANARIALPNQRRTRKVFANG